jgi:hypothetical protein
MFECGSVLSTGDEPVCVALVGELAYLTILQEEGDEDDWPWEGSCEGSGIFGF